MLNKSSLEEATTKGIYLNNINTSSGINRLLSIEAPCVCQCEIFVDFNLTVGAFTGIYGFGRLRFTHVGRYCSIAPGLQTGWDEHPTDRITSSMAAYVPNVHGWANMFGQDVENFRISVPPFHSIKGISDIGNDVWIGANVFIRSGVTIGDGAIIGSGSVVTSNIPAYAVAAGVPARVIKYRFSDDIIDRLIRIKWWNFNIYEIPPKLYHNIDLFLDWLDEAIDANRIKPYNPFILTGAMLGQCT